jgi:tetratricopeptide (TPR) repeat protein
MKKQLLFTLLSGLLCTALSAQIKTPAPSPAAVVSQNVGLTKVTVEYSRPSVKGRKIFGNIVPYDKVWRTGANKITTIKFDNDVLVNGQKLAAGNYGLYTIPGLAQWTVIFNSDDKQWGAYAYDQKKDVLRLTVKPEKLVAKVENLNIDLEQNSPTQLEVRLSWEKTAVRFKVTHDAHEQILAEIKDKTAKADCTTDTYFDAADYYYEKGLDLNQAAAWADKVVEKDKQYWTYQLRARIYAKLGQCEKAVADAKISLEMAKKDGDDAYIKKNEQILKQCAAKSK